MAACGNALTFPAACLTGDALAQSVLPQARGEHGPGRGMLIWVYAGQDTEVLARQMATMLRLPVPAVMSVVDDVDDSFWEYFNHHEWLTATSMPLEDTLHPSKISGQKNERLGRAKHHR